MHPHNDGFWRELSRLGSLVIGVLVILLVLGAIFAPFMGWPFYAP